MTSLPLEVPDEASLVRFSHWGWLGIRNQVIHAMFNTVHRRNSPNDLCAKCYTVAASSLLAMPIVSLFPLQLMTMWKELRRPALLKGNFSILQPGPYFPIFFLTKWLMGTIIFETGPVLSETAATGSCETGGNVILLSTSKVCPQKVLVFATDRPHNIMERVPTEIDLFF